MSASSDSEEPEDIECLVCNVCNKKYHSHAQLAQHLGSKRHRQTLSSLGLNSEDGVIKGQAKTRRRRSPRSPKPTYCSYGSWGTPVPWGSDLLPGPLFEAVVQHALSDPRPGVCAVLCAVRGCSVSWAEAVSKMEFFSRVFLDAGWRCLQPAVDDPSPELVRLRYAASLSTVGQRVMVKGRQTAVLDADDSVWIATLVGESYHRCVAQVLVNLGNRSATKQWSSVCLDPAQGAGEVELDWEAVRWHLLKQRALGVLKQETAATKHRHGLQGCQANPMLLMPPALLVYRLHCLGRHSDAVCAVWGGVVLVWQSASTDLVTFWLAAGMFVFMCIFMLAWSDTFAYGLRGNRVSYGLQQKLSGAEIRRRLGMLAVIMVLCVINPIL